jgi:urease accessory protein
MDDTRFVTTDRSSDLVSRTPFQILFFQLLLLLLVIFTLPAPAEAHLNSTGMGPIYDGLMHFMMSPEDLVPTFALALLAGLRGAAYGRRAAFTLPVAWLVGSLFALTAAATAGSAVLSSLWFLLLGGLVIADAKLPLSAMTALAALCGLVHGYLNGTGMGQSGFAVAAVVGLTFGVFVLIVLAAAFVVQLRAYWARIAVRVAGSWIAASGLLMLGWSFHGN